MKERKTPVFMSKPCPSSARLLYHKQKSLDQLDSELLSRFVTHISRSTRADSEDDLRHRKSAAGSTKCDLGSSQGFSKHGILPIYDSTDSLDSRHSFTTMRLRHRSSLFDGTTRFPKLAECAHFHYDYVELPSVKVCIGGELDENYRHNEEEGAKGPADQYFTLRVASGHRIWNIRRTYDNFRQLDRQLHKCIYDRKFSHLPELQREWGQTQNNREFLHGLLSQYLERLSSIAGSMINCGPILNWFELDNRGNHLLAVDDSGINTPAIAAAHAVKRYTAQAADEISLEVGDIVSVIDMPPPEDTIWWRGKRGFEVGFFPSECVEVIGDKVPQSMASRIPDPPQKAVLRKHGKLITFFRTFFSNRPSRNELKQSGIVKERVFSCDLGEHLLNSGHDVPLVLKCCTDVIENHGIVDGIYRLSGIASNIQKLRLAFDEDRAPDLTSETYLQDIHSISSLLKMYFRELPNPLLTYQLYDKFAEAVKDEDNKLLKIHDVVQQLPPPHYRTTQYLMRHLARVAAHGHLTGMHSKNLAIVWAPNLLRSKELEIGGGAAALQGVGIQAVVTEFLICYADLIFSDRIPAYSSPDANRSQKKPRPKSLAISTPTRLLSLEEARERALTTTLHPQSQKFIDVGGGPENLPSKYHTVLDLPGYKKKAKDTKEPVKQKKSPVGGWKSFFSKSRSSSLKVGKGRKSSVPDPLTLGEQKAITEEDVHNWKRRRLRTAKSVESLTSNRGSRFFDFGSFDSSMSGPASQNLPRKRSSSSSSRSRSQSLDRNMFGSSSSRETVKEMAIDIGPIPKTGSPKVGVDKENTSPGECKLEKKTSFIRGDSTRRAVFHRKTASAPSNQLQLEDSPPPTEAKRSSQQSAESSSVRRKKSDKNKGPVESHLEISVPVGEVTITREMADKFVLRVDSKEIFRPPDQADKPVEGRAPTKGDKSGKGGKGKKKTKGDKGSADAVCTVDLAESPSVRRKQSEESRETGVMRRSEQSMELEEANRLPPSYFSRYHDYAEILEDQQDTGVMQEARVSKEHEQGEQYPPDTRQEKEPSEKQLEDIYNVAESEHVSDDMNNSVDKLMSDVEKFEQSIHERPVEYSNPRMSKSLSIPSDIQRSLDNVNLDSQSDLMSSVTISELSRSVDSFNLGLSDTEGEGSLWRSTSLGGDQESPLGRTLREINAQIDKAFQADPSTPNEQLYMYPVDENLCFTIPDVPTLDTTTMLEQPLYAEYDDEDTATPTNETHFEFDNVPRSSYSTVDQATVSLAQPPAPQYTSVESLSRRSPAHSPTLHHKEGRLGAQDYRESTVKGPTAAVGHTEGMTLSVPGVSLSYDVVQVPSADITDVVQAPSADITHVVQAPCADITDIVEASADTTEQDKSQVSSLESAKRQLDADFGEIHSRMRESQLTEGEYVQLEDEDYVRLQQDAQFSGVDTQTASQSGQAVPKRGLTKADQSSSRQAGDRKLPPQQQHKDGSPSAEFSLPLSVSDEKFWQNTEFPGLSPLSDVIDAYCCNLKTEGKACEIHEKRQSSGSSDQTSPERYPEFDTPLRIDEEPVVESSSLKESGVESGRDSRTHSPPLVHIQLPREVSPVAELHQEEEEENVGDVQVSYQIDFRKSGGFDILTDEESAPGYQEISTECYIATSPEVTVSGPPSPSQTDSSRQMSTSHSEVVEERKRIQKREKSNESVVQSDSSADGLSPEEWYSKMLQHSLGQSSESSVEGLEAIWAAQHDSSPTGSSSGSSKRPYDTMVEEQKYVDSLVAQRAFGFPAAAEVVTSPVKKLKDGSHEEVREIVIEEPQPSSGQQQAGCVVCPEPPVHRSPEHHSRVASNTQSSQVAPPKHDELIAVRQKVTKTKTSKPVEKPSRDMGSSEIISVHEVTSDLGNAKLIVERRAIDKKRVQTVHATKVEQPLKQHAESLDSLSNIGIGQSELKISKSHEYLMERRDHTDVSPRMTTSACELPTGVTEQNSPDTMSTSLTSSTDTFVSGNSDSDFTDFYMDHHGGALSMTGSGYLVQSTPEDAFAVQKAASLPNVGSWSPPVDSDTLPLQRGALSSSRSGKLKSLKELFEPSSAENATASLRQGADGVHSSPHPTYTDQGVEYQWARHARGQSPRSVTFKDDPLPPESDPVKWQVSALYQRHDQNYPPEKSQAVRQKWQNSEANSSGHVEHGAEFPKARVRIVDPPKSPSGKPPAHRNPNIRTRTHSDSALEESGLAEDEVSGDYGGDMSTGSLDRDQCKKSNLQRKGSIRELVAVFENKGDVTAETRSNSRGSLPTDLSTSRESLDRVLSGAKSGDVRTASSDPQRGRSPAPTDSASVRHQSVRLGPKPFYGSKS
ncbi:uncharacterized protein LOC135465995 [Liolophura sinensis]|uniref:uncharacterized protein LOC135465995 n=1 Tax=Liolophura sinensis TaxID=3198878 RepID=UPI003158F515